MRPMKKTTAQWALRGIGILALIALAVWPCSIVAPGLFMGRQIKQRQIRLLCETDYATLLKDCRHLSQDVTDGTIKKCYWRRGLLGNLGMSKLPKSIRTLRPRSVSVYDDGRVNISMFSGWWPFGVYIYPEDYEVPYTDFKYGDRKLANGLWYYDDGYKQYADFDKTVDALIAEAGTNEGDDPPK